MAFTYQSVIDLARIPLNDSDKARYSDEQLLLFANHGILTLTKRRPDLFIGQFSSLPTGEAIITDSIPTGNEYAQLLADYVVARAEMTDDEHVNSSRAIAFVNMFGSEAPI